MQETNYPLTVLASDFAVIAGWIAYRWKDAKLLDASCPMLPNRWNGIMIRPVKFRFALLALALTFLSPICTQVHAQINVTYGSFEAGNFFVDLLPDTANQSVQFFASGLAGAGGADGLEFDVQVGDGGTALGGSDTGPTIQSVEMASGTIWSGSSPNQSNDVVTPLAIQSNMTTSSLVTSDGLIATVLFDTTGISDTTIGLRTSGVAGSFNTTFFNGATALSTTAPNGFIRVAAIPEPSAIGILALGLTGLALRRRRSKI